MATAKVENEIDAMAERDIWKCHDKFKKCHYTDALDFYLLTSECIIVHLPPPWRLGVAGDLV